MYGDGGRGGKVRREGKENKGEGKGRREMKEDKGGGEDKGAGEGENYKLVSSESGGKRRDGLQSAWKIRKIRSKYHRLQYRCPIS